MGWIHSNFPRLPTALSSTTPGRQCLDFTALLLYWYIVGFAYLHTQHKRRRTRESNSLAWYAPRLAAMCCGLSIYTLWQKYRKQGWLVRICGKTTLLAINTDSIQSSHTRFPLLYLSYKINILLIHFYYGHLKFNSLL